MSWIAITEAHLVDHIAGAELESLRAAALAAGQVDPVQTSINQVTEEVRGYVAGCKTNKLSTDATLIPSRLLRASCSLTVAVIISRVPGYPLSVERVEAKKEALTLLRAVMSCDYAIEDPDTGAESGSGSELVESRPRAHSRKHLDGI